MTVRRVLVLVVAVFALMCADAAAVEPPKMTQAEARHGARWTARQIVEPFDDRARISVKKCRLRGPWGHCRVVARGDGIHVRFVVAVRYLALDPDHLWVQASKLETL